MSENWAFPQDKRAALEAADKARQASTAHFHKPVDLPGVGKMPMMMPTQEEVQRPVQRQAVTQHAPIGFNGARTGQAPGNGFAQERTVPNQGFDWLQQQAPQPIAASIPDPMTQAPNPPLGFNQPVADGEGVSVALPSRFHYYGFKDLYVKPFVAKHLAKLQKAHREQSLLPIVEAVSSVIYTSDPNYRMPLAFQLSMPDFFFVLYYLRLNSYTKSNYTHTTRCNNEEHVSRVLDHKNAAKLAQQLAKKEISQEEFDSRMARAMPEESLKISQLITKTDLRTIELETIPDPERFRFEDTDALYLRPPTMQDVLEFAEAPQMQDPNHPDREEFAFLAQLASHIQHKTMYLTLAQRVQILENATADQVDMIKGFEQAIADYGVVEKVKVTCKECGHTRESKLSIAAHSFFPFNER